MPPNGEIILYQTEDGRTRVEYRSVEYRFEHETLWMSQGLMAELFQTSPQNITLHLKALYAAGEIAEAATCKEYLQVQWEGAREVRRAVKHYSLEAILAVGYHVRSERGKQFRRWATERLREYLVKGFTMDDERLKNSPVAGASLPVCFDELLERIRDIRASEKQMYLRVREIFALAGDYNPSSQQAALFFQTIQNRLHFAATSMTAPELLTNRADHAKPDRGLTSWKGDAVRRADITVAKNYLNQNEIGELNRIVTMGLDFAEDQAIDLLADQLKDGTAEIAGDTKIGLCPFELLREEGIDRDGRREEKRLIPPIVVVLPSTRGSRGTSGAKRSRLLR
jgi:hypothetical protein